MGMLVGVFILVLIGYFLLFKLKGGTVIQDYRGDEKG